MKKLISFILTITLLFVLTSCGGKNKDNGKQGDLYLIILVSQKQHILPILVKKHLI